jgi:large subunit ribosomal protein L18
MADLTKKKSLEKRRRRVRAHQRSRQRLAGTTECPRLNVFKSERYVYAQVIDDERGHTLVAAASVEKALRGGEAGGSASRAAAKRVGEAIAERAIAKGIRRVVFDRGGYRYHGKVKELAEAARAKGLEF